MSTPVIFFAYNRPQQTLRVLEALSRQSKRPESILAFSDAPARPEDEPGVREVRKLLRTFRNVPIVLVERPANLGSAGNIVAGLNDVFAHHPQAIIVEDDVLPSETFCEAMERMLDVYRQQIRIFSVGGYPIIYPNSLRHYPYDVILSARFACWGWATWADRWQKVGSHLLSYQPHFPSLEQIPRHAGDDVKQIVRSVNKYPGRYWDYPLILLSLEQNWLHALTKEYLINNIGFNGGVNYMPNPRLEKFMLKTNPLSLQIPSNFPAEELKPETVAAVRRYIGAMHRAARPSWLDRVYAFTLRSIRWWRSH